MDTEQKGANVLDRYRTVLLVAGPIIHEPAAFQSIVPSLSPMT
jgi:hypothetical protein